MADPATEVASAPVDIRAMFDMPPEDAIRYLASKGYRLTTNWQEMWHGDHVRAFTVSKVARLDILEALRASMAKADAAGMTKEQWQAGIIPELKKLGWWGDVADEDTTGTPETVKITPHRLNTIFDTNFRTSRAAALWQRIQASKGLLPYLRYSAVMDRRTRPQHAAWHGTILPVDDPWWQTHFPPNGWRCRCTVVQVNEAMIARRGWTVSAKAPDDGPPIKFRRRGQREEIDVPRGIDPGFAYNPGAGYFDALKPPPLSGPIARPYPNARDANGPLTPLPPPRKVPEAALLPRNSTNEQAADSFVESFNEVADIVDGNVIFTDKIGESLVIDRSFFMRGDEWKLTSDRREVINLLAMAVQDPDEIWWNWESVEDAEAPGGRRYRLTRRYVARFEIDGKARTALIVMQVGKSGWQGVSAFASARPNYPDSPGVRVGVLAYRRE
jgi:SPP1 gp7 family putative phage head morphogenesis protein